MRWGCAAPLFLLRQTGKRQKALNTSRTVKQLGAHNTAATNPVQFQAPANKHLVILTIFTHILKKSRLLFLHYMGVGGLLSIPLDPARNSVHNGGVKMTGAPMATQIVTNIIFCT